MILKDSNRVNKQAIIGYLITDKKTVGCIQTNSAIFKRQIIINPKHTIIATESRLQFLHRLIGIIDGVSQQPTI